MKKILSLNPGQKPFVNGPERFSAYIGGLGSGKTFSGIVRGLRFAQQDRPPGVLYGPRGMCAAISYPVLVDVVVPEFFKVIEGTGLLKQYIRSEKKAILTNGAEVLFRSLDEPNKIRGVELSWFFIDEGRHVKRESWNILSGRLRQPGYTHGGWVCSTPAGYDWMWELFHPDSPDHQEGAHWFGASTYENKHNVGDDYIKSLEATYEGKFFRQEVLGEFIGLMHGAVFPEFDRQEHTVPLEYDPHLPLYSLWDFGIGDPTVVVFVQIAWLEKQLPSGGTEFVPELRILDYLEGPDQDITQWAKLWRAWLRDNVGGRIPDSSWGDPAGKQRGATGVSWISGLQAAGVPINPAPKRPADYGALILRNMMAGGRVLVNAGRADRVANAISTHRWNTTESGERIGNSPVHDWTGHLCDPLRYGAAALLSYHHKRTSPPPEQPHEPGTMGYLLSQLDRKHDPWLGPQEEAIGPYLPAARLLGS